MHPQAIVPTRNAIAYDQLTPSPEPTIPSPKAPLHSFAPRCAAISQKKPLIPGEATAKLKPSSTENCQFGRFSFFTRPDETNLLSTKLKTRHDYTERLPACAGRISDVIFQVLKYDVFCDSAVGG